MTILSKIFAAGCVGAAAAGDTPGKCDVSKDYSFNKCEIKGDGAKLTGTELKIKSEKFDRTGLKIEKDGDAKLYAKEGTGSNTQEITQSQGPELGTAELKNALELILTQEPESDTTKPCYTHDGEKHTDFKVTVKAFKAAAGDKPGVANDITITCTHPDHKEKSTEKSSDDGACSTTAIVIIVVSCVVVVGGIAAYFLLANKGGDAGDGEEEEEEEGEGEEE